MPSLYIQVMLVYSLILALLIGVATDKKQYGSAAFLVSLLISSVIVLK